MKKLINDPKAVVDESVEGFGLAHADLVTVFADPKYVVRKDAPVAGKVGLVSGGGSGHEPLHGGLSGRECSTPPCRARSSPRPPRTRSSPATARRKRRRRRAAHREELHRRRAELRDRGRAGRRPRASRSARSSSTTTSRSRTRCTPPAGAASAAPCSWRRSPGRPPSAGTTSTPSPPSRERVNQNVRCMGVALTACTVPHAGEPSFTLEDDEIEIGIGIHGEPGRHRITMENADGIVGPAARTRGQDLRLASGDKVLLFVNGMGGTPQSELYIVYRRAAQVLAEQGVAVARSLVGNYITVPRNAGLLHHGPAPGRRDDRPLGRARPHAGPPLGRLSRGPWISTGPCAG